VSCIVNKVIFDESISDAQISQNTKGDAGHQRRTLWWLGAGRLSPWGVGLFWHIISTEIIRTYILYARKISGRFYIQNRPIKFSLIYNTEHLGSPISNGTPIGLGLPKILSPISRWTFINSLFVRTGKCDLLALGGPSIVTPVIPSCVFK